MTASPVEARSVVLRVSPVHIYGWLINEALHKIEIARGTGIPEFSLYGIKQSERKRHKKKKKKEEERMVTWKGKLLSELGTDWLGIPLK